MCGICGIINLNEKPVEGRTLIQMRDTVIHRGPDDAGIFIDNNVGLGHRRLSIIDIEGSHQPMSNEDGTVWITYNGEIYNYKELREFLIKKGHKFKTKGDTEVLIHLYEEYGENMVEKLNGMFSFAVWDKKRERLILARDRVGIKPLYYYYKGGNFAFASEIKSLFQHPKISKDIDFDALNLYFAFGYIPQNYSIFKDIRKLLPGHMLIYQNGNMRVSRYWNFTTDDELNGNECELLDQLYTLLKESIKLRMVSDVPIGVFLSGGIDSSIIATIMASLSSKPIKTFSIGFQEAKYNELPYAREIAKHISSDHHEFIVKINAMEILDKISQQYDEPFADSSAIPTYCVSKMAKDYVTVVLSGDGGDELFGGYNWYSWVKSGVEFSKRFTLFANILGKVGQLLPNGMEGKHYLERLGKDETEQFWRRVFIFEDEARKHLLKKSLIDDSKLRLPENTLYTYFNSLNTDIVKKMEWTDFKFYLPEDILSKVDRASMLVSLETRVPFLDHNICEFAFKVPSEFKIRKGIKKYLLKKLAKRILPKDFPLERKQGFSIPLKEWMQKDLAPTVKEVAFHPTVKTFINTDYVLKILMEHKSGKVNNSAKLWSVLMFGLWVRNYL